MKRTLLVALLLSITTVIAAQSSIKVMSYNLLDFPDALPANRKDTLQKILNYVQPDLLLLQEISNSTGLALATQAFADFDAPYSPAQWWSQQSNYPTDFPLQQNIIFNQNKFGLVEQDFIMTAVRDINYYKLYLKTADLATGGDTVYLSIFVTHLKAGNTASDAQTRAGMVQNFINALPAFASTDLALFAGDFNVYNSTEEAYQMLLSPDNAIVFQDPIDAPGNWSSSSYPFKQILTQSTRSSAYLGEGAGGGVDDRFDFILASEQLMNPSSPLYVVPDSYMALGNNGNCYNMSITSCNNNNNVPFDILRSLYYMSDHLPVVMELESEVELFVHHETSSPPSIFSTDDGFFVRGLSKTSDATIFDLSGRVVTQLYVSNGLNYLPQLAKGTYIVQLNMDGSIINQTIVIQ